MMLSLAQRACARGAWGRTVPQLNKTSTQYLAATSTTTPWLTSRRSLQTKKAVSAPANPAAAPANKDDAPVVVYDRQSLQPLAYSVGSGMTVALFAAFAATQMEPPQDANTMVNIMLSPFWNYFGIAIGLINLYGATKFPKFLISEVAVTRDKILIRTHTFLGWKNDVQEVFNKGDLVRIRNTRADMINWRSQSTKRRFTLYRTDDVEKLAPMASDATATSTIQANVGGKSLEDTIKFEKALKQRWKQKSK